MCGIVGYIGERDGFEVVTKGLKRLEYRGYDSAGVATFLNEKIDVKKRKGKVSDLEEVIDEKSTTDNKAIIGHTRWATHGEPNDRNAHPHLSNNSRYAIIHNGIIENYNTLKEELITKGYTFESETDTEVLINFIDFVISSTGSSPFDGIIRALKRVVGAYGILIIDKEEPDVIYAARKGSPLVIGVGTGEHFLASDATPIVEYTNDIIYLKDEEVCMITAGDIRIQNLNKVSQLPEIQKIDLDLEAIEKGGYEHFMEKEIFEQPESLYNTIRGRVHTEKPDIVLGGITKYAQALINAKKITMLGCGTSWHAGLVSEYLFEDVCRIPVEVEYASEFRYRNPIVNEGDVFIAISQSGETADTLAGIELAKEKGAIVFGVVNTVGSSIARETHEGAYLHAGPEIGVASTKAFTSQVMLLSMIAVKVGYLKGNLNREAYHQLAAEISLIPEKVKTILEKSNDIKNISQRFADASNLLYLGRGSQFPVALEGALKLKEISYIHAEGYPAAEMKHGPIALIDENMPVVFIAIKDDSYQKIISNIQEVKARKGIVLAIVNEGDETIKKIVDYVIEVPFTPPVLAPLLTVIPLQLLSYYIAIARGCNVDQPRNLAKSVTVE